MAESVPRLEAEMDTDDLTTEIGALLDIHHGRKDGHPWGKWLVMGLLHQANPTGAALLWADEHAEEADSVKRMFHVVLSRLQNGLNERDDLKSYDEERPHLEAVARLLVGDPRVAKWLKRLDEIAEACRAAVRSQT